MASRDGLQGTNKKGLFYRKHPTRRHGVKKDRQWVIRQTLAGKTRISVFGWLSGGHSEGDAINKVDEYISNHKWNRLNPDQPAKPICKADENRLAKVKAEAIKQQEKRLANRPTFQYLWNKYSETLSKSLAADRSRFNNHLTELHDKAPEELYPLDIERLKKALALKDLSPQTIKHCLTLVTRLVNYGVDQQLCTPLSFRIKKPSFDNQVTEILSENQLHALLSAIEGDLKQDPFTGRAMLLALATGMRRGELLKLQWQDVDFTFNFITLSDTKSRKVHRIPMNDSTRKTLEEIPSAKSPYVFFGKIIEDENGNPLYKQRSDFDRGSRRIRKAAGLPKKFRPFHGLRHHFASALASSGKVDLYTLQRLLTHADPKTTERYAHLHDDRLKLGAAVADTLFKRNNKQTIVNLTHKDRGQ